MGLVVLSWGMKVCVYMCFGWSSVWVGGWEANRKKTLTGLEELEALGERVRGPCRGHHRPVLRLWIGLWVGVMGTCGRLRYQVSGAGVQFGS